MGREEKKKRRNACTFLSLDVLLKFVRHLSPPFPSLMIPAESLWGMASVARLAFTFPAPGILGYASGDYEAHHSKSSCGSLPLYLFLSCFLPPLQSTPLLSSFLLLLYFCIRRHSLSHSSSPSSFLPTSLSLSLILFDLARMISSVEGEKKNACTGGGGIFLLTYSLYVKSRGFFLSPPTPPLHAHPPSHPLG